MRYHTLSQELRCPKCQNQNIADSNAPIARDLRVVLYEQLETGASDEEILATWSRATVSSFVIVRRGPQHLFLWAAPALLLVAGRALWCGRHAEVASGLNLECPDQEEISRLLEEQGG
ncbi:MAG: hypothetical protein CM15mP74_10300 [Halieaceae bacterium]|nr:MAG: hypothetical protein CM15mP74_10300 [Halieaceae bacterium]